MFGRKALSIKSRDTWMGPCRGASSKKKHVLGVHHSVQMAQTAVAGYMPDFCMRGMKTHAR